MAAGWLFVTVTVNLYDQSPLAGIASVGPAVIVALKLEKLNRFSKPGVVPVRCGNEMMISWLLMGPPVISTRQGMKSSSCQFCRLPAIQFVAPLDCPCSAKLAAWVRMVAKSENAASITVLNIRAVIIGSGSFVLINTVEASVDRRRKPTIRAGLLCSPGCFAKETTGASPGKTCGSNAEQLHGYRRNRSDHDGGKGQVGISRCTQAVAC